MLRQDVDAEIAAHIAPYRVNVIGPVLHVVELEHERRSLHPIIIGLSSLRRSRPRELQPIESRLLNPRELFLRHFRPIPAYILAQQSTQSGHLLGIHLRRPQARWSQELRFPIR